MERAVVELKVLELLKKSKIPDHDKNMVKLLLSAMDEPVLMNVFDALKKEVSKLDILSEKKKRIKLKYQVMVEKLNDYSS